MAEVGSYTLFKVGPQLFAYETEKVLETVKVDRVFPVPSAPEFIKGVLNLRNKVIPVIDTGVLLWSEKTEGDTMVIVDLEGSPVGLLVDKVIGISRVSEEDVRSKEEVEIGKLREEVIRSVFEVDGRIVFVINLSDIVKAPRKQGNRRKKQKSTEAGARTDQKEKQRGFVIFPVGEEWLAFPVEEVKEIIDFPDSVSKVPQSPEYVEGVFLLRGEEVALVSLGKALSIPSRSTAGRVIIAGVGNTLLGIAVDDVKEIRWFSESAIISQEREGIKGILVLDEGRRLVSILSPSEIFDLSALGDNRREEKNLREEVKKVRNFIRFRLKNVDMAVPIERVKEVIELENVTPLPNSPDYVRGAYNLRNSVIVVIDLPSKLGLGQEDESDRVIVLEDMPVGLVVSSLQGIIKTEEDNIQPAEDLTGVEENLLEGIIKTSDGGIIFILDVDRAVSEEDIKLIKEEVRENGSL